MKRFVIPILLIVLLIASPSYARDKKLVEQVKNSVAILYSQDGSGGMSMRCTVTAFEQLASESVVNGKKVAVVEGYLFATAAHCVGSDDATKERSADTKTTPFFITFDDTHVKQFYEATPVFVGYQSRGEDFAVFKVKTNEKWSTVPIGDEKKASDGDDVINVSVPQGLGKQVLYGNITSVFLDRPIIEGDINWKGTIALSIGGVNGGSSGSAIVSEDQGAIIGFLVGTIGGSTITAIPISRFVAVRKAVLEKLYKYYTPTVQLNPDGTPAQ